MGMINFIRNIFENRVEPTNETVGAQSINLNLPKLPPEDISIPLPIESSVINTLVRYAQLIGVNNESGLFPKVNPIHMEYKVTNKERAQKTSMINVFEDAIQDNKIHVQYNPILSWEIGNCSRFSTDFGEKNYERKLKGDRIMATIDGVDAIVHSLHYYIKRKDTTLKSQGNGMAKLAERLKKL